MHDGRPDAMLDCKGMSCPFPVLKAKKAIDALKPGQTLFVEVTDRGSKADIPAFLKRTGNELLESRESNGIFSFLIRKTKF